MEEYKKDDRGRSKAQRLTKNDPQQKVDSSTWTPSAPENAGVKTGARPLTKRLYKKGGKVIGKDAMKRADRKPRKAGGRTEHKAPWVDDLINRDVRMANDKREGVKHEGAFKKGGKTHKLGGGTIGDNPISVQDRSMAKATGMMKKGGRAKKRADGGDVIGDMIRQDQIEQGMKGRGQPARVPMPPRRPADAPPAPYKGPVPDYAKKMGAKKGGKIEHSDEAQDKKLMHKVLKPKAFKAEGGSAHGKDCSCKMCSGGRTMKYAGGGVFSGNSKQKVPGATGGRKAREGGGRNVEENTPPMASYNFLTGWSDLDKATPDQIAAMKPQDRQMALAAQGPSRGVMPAAKPRARHQYIGPNDRAAVGSGRGVAGPTADQLRAAQGPTAEQQQGMMGRGQGPATTQYGLFAPRFNGQGEPGISFSRNVPDANAVPVFHQGEMGANEQAATDMAAGRWGDAHGGAVRGHHAKGGRTKAGKTTINIVMGGHGQQPQGNMPNAPVQPPRPPMGVPVPPPQMAGGAPPMGGMPPQMPPQMPRATGGRTGKMVGGSLGNAQGFGQPAMGGYGQQQQPMMGGVGQQGMMQQPNMMPRKSGGRTNYPIDTGAGGANARLEKIDAYGLTPPKRK
jgi:hypothetical protein